MARIGVRMEFEWHESALTLNAVLAALTYVVSYIVRYGSWVQGGVLIEELGLVLARDRVFDHHTGDLRGDERERASQG